MNKVNYIAVDDEKVFLDVLEEKLASYGFLNQLATFTHPFDAIEYIKQYQPPVIFLDYEMPGLSGHKILEEIDYKAEVIFITSHFNPIQEVINHKGTAILQGYLSKPIEKEQLEKVCLKLSRSAAKNQNNKLAIPNGKTKQHFVDICDLSYIKSSGKYTNWYFKNSPALSMINLQLNQAEEMLSQRGLNFIKAHKSYLVCENGIIEKNTKDFIVHSKGCTNDRNEVPFSDSTKITNWIKRFFG